MAEAVETFAVTNTVHGNGTGPVLFSSFSFSPDDVSVLVIPKVIVGKKGDKSWITWVGSDPQPILNSERADLPKTSVTWQVSESSDQAWKSGVKNAVDRIHNNGLDKVELARDVVELQRMQ